MSRRKKFSSHEVTEVGSGDLNAAVSSVDINISSGVAEASPVIEKESIMENLTEVRKIKKVKYEVTFPNPDKLTFTPEQQLKMAKSFFAAKTGYLLRQDVNSEASTLEINKNLLESMKAYGLKLGQPEDVVTAMALEFCKSRDANFRTEPTTSFAYGLDEIFKVEEKPEEESEEKSETPAA